MLMRLHIVANVIQLGGTVNTETEIAWVDLKTEITIMLSTGNRREQRGETWSVDLEVGLVLPTPSHLYISYNYHRYCPGLFIFPKHLG